MDILVSQELAEEAKRIIEPKDIRQKVSKGRSVKLITSAIFIGLLVMVILSGSA